MISKGEKVKLAISLGVEVETAIALFDRLETIDLPKAKAAKKARNEAYYQENKADLKEKRKNKKVKPLSADLSQIQPIKPVKSARYLAKVGTPQYDAWNAFERDRKGKGLPYSDKVNGWYVEAEWPPNYRAA